MYTYHYCPILTIQRVKIPQQAAASNCVCFSIPDYHITSSYNVMYTTNTSSKNYNALLHFGYSFHGSSDFTVEKFDVSFFAPEILPEGVTSLETPMSRNLSLLHVSPLGRNFASVPIL